MTAQRRRRQAPDLDPQLTLPLNRPVLGLGGGTIPVVIRIEPISLPWAEALHLRDEVFAQECGTQVEPGWAGFPETVPMLVRYARSQQPAVWGPHLVFDDDGTLIGNGGWKGTPVHGVAELGYAVAPARRNRGVATALVNHLLTTARDEGLRLAIAHTLPAESASTRVLRKCGFHLRETVVDPDDGPVWRWERQLTPEA
ncbi:MAG: GNAT family N-acetyltransferase [Actinophytocola sp.]|nr:GNAT family N-acetyltransferase [Actinophytocola sp.]